MDALELKEEDRKVVGVARKKLEDIKSKQTEPASAIAFELPDGTMITGKASPLMDAASAAILNAVKYFAGINDEILLISPVVLEPILNLKDKTLQSKNIALNCEEILMALSICAATNPMAQVAVQKLSMLKGTQAHCTNILGKTNEQTLRKLGIDLTCDQVFPTENLYYND